jgi:hypothetical protein
MLFEWIRTVPKPLPACYLIFNLSDKQKPPGTAYPAVPAGYDKKHGEQRG